MDVETEAERDEATTQGHRVTYGFNIGKTFGSTGCIHNQYTLQKVLSGHNL